MLRDKSREEKMRYFKEVVFDENRLIDVLELDVKHSGRAPVIIFKENFFLQFSSHPIYLRVIKSLLNETYALWCEMVAKSQVVGLDEYRSLWVQQFQQVLVSKGLSKE